MPIKGGVHRTEGRFRFALLPCSGSAGGDTSQRNRESGAQTRLLRCSVHLCTLYTQGPAQIMPLPHYKTSPYRATSM